MIEKVSLVTGVAGFIGSHVAEELLKQGRKVVGVDDLSGGVRRNVPDGVQFYEGDLLDDEIVTKIFSEHEVDRVYHLAAYAAEGLSHFIRVYNYENNLIASMKLLNASVQAGVKSFVFASSIAVYGGQEPPLSEDTMPVPEDPYAIAKLAVEQDLKAAHEMWGLNYVILRAGNVYGERQNIEDNFRNVIGIFMRQILEGQPLTIFGDGEQTRGFSYVRDISPIIARAGYDERAQNNTFNIGSDRSYSVNVLAEMVAQAMGCELNVRHLPARMEVKHAVFSLEKIREHFGQYDLTPLEEGIRAMADFVKSTERSPIKPFTHLEIARNLPPSWVPFLKEL